MTGSFRNSCDALSVPENEKLSCSQPDLLFLKKMFKAIFSFYYCTENGKERLKNNPAVFRSTDFLQIPERNQWWETFPAQVSKPTGRSVGWLSSSWPAPGPASCGLYAQVSSWWLYKVSRNKAIFWSYLSASCDNLQKLIKYNKRQCMTSCKWNDPVKQFANIHIIQKRYQLHPTC